MRQEKLAESPGTTLGKALAGAEDGAGGALSLDEKTMRNDAH